MLSIHFNGLPPGSNDAGGMSLRAQLDHAFEALGFTRGLPVPAAPAVSVKSTDTPREPSLQELADADQAAHHDETATTGELNHGSAAVQAEAPKPRRGRPPKAAHEERGATPETMEAVARVATPEPAPQISANPEDRRPPEEAAAALTHDDVRQAIGAYGQKFGDEVAVKNGRTFMGLLPGQKIPEIPTDRIAAVVAALRGAIASGKPEPASAVDDLG